MNMSELTDLITQMREIGNDTQMCEVKESVKKLPETVLETLSAFSNSSGGTLILGISEKEGFKPAKGFRAKAMQEALNAACEKMTPRVRPIIEILPFENSQVVVAHIEEMSAFDKPCYVTTKGRYQGSFIRTGDGDRRLTQYEIDKLIEERTQPTFDDEIVDVATIDDLNTSMVNQFVTRQKLLHPRIFAQLSDENILIAMHVLKRKNNVLKPTLGGLLALGTFPQQFFPRLNVTVTVFPGVSKTETIDESRRFIDTQSIVGSIPLLIEDALSVVAKNMKVGAVIDGAFRKDVPDYPLKAVREAVANALIHRDYSPDARGSQVQINMYADRIEIINPGGLYGNMTISDLGKTGISFTRNQFLSNILESTPYPDGGFVVENRGTGYFVIEEELAHALMSPPEPLNTLTFFSLTFAKRKLTDSERKKEIVEDISQAIVTLLSEQSSVSTKELVQASGLSRSAISNHLRKLLKENIIEQTEPSHSPRQRYRLVRR